MTHILHHEHISGAVRRDAICCDQKGTRRRQFHPFREGQQRNHIRLRRPIPDKGHRRNAPLSFPICHYWQVLGLCPLFETDMQYNRLYPGGRDASSDIENGSLIEIKAQGQKQSILGYMSQNVNSWLDSKCFAQPRLTNRGNALLQREQLH